jgi:hypothetical protein
MPLDPSIAMGARLPQISVLPDSPVNAMARVEEVRGAQMANQLRAMQMQQAQREAQQNELANRLYAESIGEGGEIDYGKLMQGMAQGGMASRIPGVLEQRAATQSRAADRQLREEQLRNQQLDAAYKMLKAATPENYAQLRAMGISRAPALANVLPEQFDQRVIDALTGQIERSRPFVVDRSLVSSKGEVLFQAPERPAAPPAPSEITKLISERNQFPAGSAEYNTINQRIKKLTEQTPPVSVQVSTGPQEKAFETELGKGQAKKILEDYEVAQDATKIIDTVKTGRKLLESGMITGFGAETITKLGAALNQAGINFASEPVANTQAFAANMAQNVGRVIKQFGAGTGLSNADREYAEKMAGGNITLDRKAIERILDINERAARNVIRYHNKRLEGVKTPQSLTVEEPPAFSPKAQEAQGRPSLQSIFGGKR